MKDVLQSLLKDTEYKKFWTDFMEVQSFIHRGLWPSAIDRLHLLRNHPRRPAFDPNRNVDYSLAIIQLQAPYDLDDVRASSLILRNLLKEADLGQIQADPVTVEMELASAMSLLGRFSEAEKRSSEAIRRAGQDRDLTLAFHGLGGACFAQDRFSEAKTAFRQMLHSALEHNLVTSAGIAAEWLGRIALREQNLAEAAAWHDLANDSYRTAAPQHLQTLRDLTEKITKGTVRTPVDLLGSDAMQLREFVPAQNELGDGAGLHLDSLQVSLGALRIIGKYSKSDAIELSLPFPDLDEETFSKLSSLIASEATSILPHNWDREIIATVTKELWPDESDAIVERFCSKDSGKWSVLPAEDTQPRRLSWTSRGAGPAAYGRELLSLAILLQAAYESRLEAIRGFSSEGVLPPNLEFNNLGDRVYPRPIQVWMITNGQAAAGGVGGPAHLAEDTTRRRVLDPRENRVAFQSMGYSEEEIRELQAGSLIALRPTELSVPGGHPTRSIGTTPINETSVANPPAHYKPMLERDRPGFAIDREYNSVFFAPSPSEPDFAWYGTNNRLFRDHFSEFHKQIEIVGSVRAKHYSIPIVDVRSYAELTKLQELLCQALERLKVSKHVVPNAKVWFRGQVNAYPLRRSEVVSRYLFGAAKVEEPSLSGAAPRHGWNYLKAHSFLSTMLQARIYREASARGEQFTDTLAKWEQLPHEAGQWDLGVMLLAQHYGVPTHGIDITNDLDVAVWFATNVYTDKKDGTRTYCPLGANGWGKEPSKWPHLYAILPVTHSLRKAVQHVDVLEPFGIEALRPKRQSAAFFMGAHGLHKNRLAEALVCVMRLAPGDWPTRSTYSSLFPNAEEDPTYAWMLDLKSKYTSGDIGQFLQEISTFVV
jgi:hypothetical protein